MKRIVRFEGGLACALGGIGGLIVGITDASVAVTYLIALCVGVIWMGIFLGPERVQLWREKHAKTAMKKS
jgi:hypothetical protein